VVGAMKEQAAAAAACSAGCSGIDPEPYTAVFFAPRLGSQMIMRILCRSITSSELRNILFRLERSRH